MKRAREILGPAMRRLNHSESTLAWLRGAWPSVVGERFASHAVPVNCSNSVLVVSVEGNDWQANIKELEKDLIDTVNCSWGGPLIREVRFVPAPTATAHLTPEENLLHTPFVRSKAVATGSGRPRK